MTTDEILAVLERTLHNDMAYAADSPGHTQSFRQGEVHGLSQALARVITLRHQLTDAPETPEGSK